MDTEPAFHPTTTEMIFFLTVVFLYAFYLFIVIPD